MFIANLFFIRVYPHGPHSLEGVVYTGVTNWPGLRGTGGLRDFLEGRIFSAKVGTVPDKLGQTGYCIQM